jgi:hypothetical protein
MIGDDQVSHHRAPPAPRDVLSDAQLSHHRAGLSTVSAQSDSASNTLSSAKQDKFYSAKDRYIRKGEMPGYVPFPFVVNSS